MALVVTGAAGLIGSHFVEFINMKGKEDIIAVMTSQTGINLPTFVTFH